MPASSMGSLNAWGVYLAASAVLVLIFTPQLAGVARASRAGADWRNLDGVGAVIDSLRPGITLRLHYGIVGTSDSLSIGGHSLSCFDGNATISRAVRWALPNMTLAPGVRYSLSLVQGTVRVAQAV